MYTSVEEIDLTQISSAGAYALVLQSPNRLQLRHRPHRPEIGRTDALIESMYVALCGTDLDVIDGSSDRIRPPAVLGHEWAGRVAAVGKDVDPAVIGSFVVGENVVGDDEVGFELPGGMASHFVIPASNLRALPPQLHSPWACLVEPLAVGVRAIAAVGLEPSDSVLVVGDGVIGLFLARLATLTTDQVTLVGRHDDRLQVAARLGIKRVAVQRESEAVAASHDRGWTVVLEATGREAGLNVALRAAAERAKVVLVGDYGGAPVATEATTIVRKELHVVGSNASQGAWDEAVRLAGTRAVDLGAVSLAVFSIERWRAALEAARGRRALRVVLQHQAAQ